MKCKATQYVCFQSSVIGERLDLPYFLAPPQPSERASPRVVAAAAGERGERRAPQYVLFLLCAAAAATLRKLMVTEMWS